MEDPMAYLFDDLLDDNSIYLGERMAVDENTDMDFLFAQAMQQAEEESWRQLREIEENDAQLAKQLLEEEQKKLKIFHNIEEQDRKYALSLLQTEDKSKKEENSLEFIKTFQEEMIIEEKRKRKKIEEEDEKLARSLAEKEVPNKFSLFEIEQERMHEDKRKRLESDEQLAKRLQAEFQEADIKQQSDEEIARKLQEDLDKQQAEARKKEKSIREERDRILAEKTAREERDRMFAEKTAWEERDRILAEKTAWEEQDHEMAQKLARSLEKEKEDAELARKLHEQEIHEARIREQRIREKEREARARKEKEEREARAKREAESVLGNISEAKRYFPDLSQLNNLLKTYPGCELRRVIKPDLQQRFEETWVQFQYRYGKSRDLTTPIIAFHGTKSQRMSSIEKKGLLVPGSSGVTHATDSGWYGRGIYLSPNPSLSLGYSDDGRVIICAVLMGKIFKCKNRIDGAGLQPGCDSHMSPCGQELVLFQAGQVLPLFVLNTRTRNF